VIGALLLLHHRTALLGALVTIAVFTNVCALNWLYGVPVKLASTTYLLFAIGLTAPWAGRLWALLVANRASRPVDMRVVQRPRLVWLLTLFGCAWITCHVVNQHFTRTRTIAANEQRRPKPELYGVWRVERMLVDGAELPRENATRWRDVAIDRGPELRARELTGRVHSFGLTEQLAEEKLLLAPRAGGDVQTFAAVRGTKQVPERNPLPLRNSDRTKPVDVERRTLVLRGTWNGKPLEVALVERGFPIQTPFRLRQELPDFW
jgi:hypothetical protein